MSITRGMNRWKPCTSDIKHAWRMFRENKLFTATAVAALTLGIGVNIAIFSVVNAVLLKPVPFPEPDTLVQVDEHGQRRRRRTRIVAGEVHALARADRRARGRRRGAATSDVESTGRASCSSPFAQVQVTRGVFRRASARRSSWVGGSRPKRTLPNAGYIVSPELQLLDAASEQRSERSRQERHVVRQPVHGRRRRRPRVRRPRYRAPPEIWVPFQLDPNTADQGHYFANGRRA